MLVFAPQLGAHPAGWLAQDTEGFQRRGIMAPVDDGSTSRQCLNFRFPRVYVREFFENRRRTRIHFVVSSIIEDFVVAGVTGVNVTL